MTLVLLHSPLTGPMTWQNLRAVLGQNGVDSRAPSFAGIIERGPPYYEQLARMAASAVDGLDPEKPVTLVAHSGAGALVPAIAAGCARPPSAAIFKDAILPHAGHSWMETVPAAMQKHLRALAVDGCLPPWDRWWPPAAMETLLPDEAERRRFTAELPDLPLAYFEAPAPAVASWPNARCGYLGLSDAYRAEVDAARSQAWIVHSLGSTHFGMITQPRAVASALLALNEALCT